MFIKYEYVLNGILNYYSFVDNYSRFHSIMYILKYSLINTLARKLRLNTAKVIKKYGKTLRLQLDNKKSRILKFPKSLRKTGFFKRNYNSNKDTFDIVK